MGTARWSGYMVAGARYAGKSLSCISRKEKTHEQYRNSDNIVLTTRYGQKKAFKSNNTSSLRYHIRLHFKIYKARCEEAKIKMVDRAIPPELLDTTKPKVKVKTQSTLDAALLNLTWPKEFSKAEVLRAVAEFVVCDDQVSGRMKSDDI